jgi:hypothetical protein
MSELSDEAMKEAIDRIARTADGRVLYLFLQRSMMTFPTTGSKGALRSHHGERTFAFRLMSLMGKGISESGGRTSSSSGTEQPIVFAPGKPVDTRGPRGAGRRITEHTRVPGYDHPDDG